MNEILCPIEIDQTRTMALSGQDVAVQSRIEAGLEACVGLPACEGPVPIEVRRSAVIGLFLGKITTKMVCPKVLPTVQT